MYNPFNKELADINIEDLAALRECTEGWFIEYKRELPNSKTIAKSISSFANHNGGWLFYGIEGRSGGDTSAESYPGIAIDEWPRFQERISSAVSSNTNPAPHFDCRLITGPSDMLGMDSSSGIIIIRIPRGYDTPYIHSSGRIYRRIADQSDPSAETDRSVLDILWNRRQEADDRINRILDRTPELSDDEMGQSYLTIHLIPDPLKERDLQSSINLDSFSGIMGSHDSMDPSFTCSCKYSTSSGFIARQPNLKSPSGFSLTLSHDYSGTTTAHIPIRSAPVHSSANTKHMQHYLHGSEFLDHCLNAGYTHTHWCDLNLLFTMFTATISKHDKLLHEGGIKSSYYFKGHINNVWRCIPFVDTSSYLHQLSSEGIPQLVNSRYDIHPGRGYNSLVKVDELSIDLGSDAIKRAAIPWALTMKAFGLSRQTLPESLYEVLDACGRGIRAYKQEY